MDFKWFKNAIVYSLDVETFFDGNDDGVGDFKGALAKVGYIAGLGANCIWLLPFYPSPNRDNGYDVMDYFNVDPRLGELGDFVEFVNKCSQSGIRVIIDLVINHTSNQHPWFEDARRDRKSKYRDFYVWTDDPRLYEQEHLMFKGEENSMWTFDKSAGQYYLHRFYKEQPDLNISNKDVQEEILKIMAFWLQLGVSGFRVDAAEILIETVGMKSPDKKKLEKFLGTMRTFVASKNPEAILLAETNITPDKTDIYMKGSERMHMLFNFFGNQYFFLSLAEEDPKFLIRAYKEMSQPVHDQQWLNFLRHHDELSLRLLTDPQRKKIIKAFAPRKNMLIYESGIRRRLAPMLQNDQRKLKLCYSVLFSLPGAVLLRFGDEIGMGDDLSLPGRDSVRTPMQWSSTTNGGFSKAKAGKLVHPVIDKGEYGFKSLNVTAQQQEPGSLLNWIERIITTRKQYECIAYGKTTVISLASSPLLVHTCTDESCSLLFIHNFSGKRVTVTKKQILMDDVRLSKVFSEDETISGNELKISPYGYAWFVVEKETK